LRSNAYFLLIYLFQVKKEQQEQEEKYDLESPDFRHDFYAPGHHQERDQAEVFTVPLSQILTP
jgi:hypothetical protein